MSADYPDWSLYSYMELDDDGMWVDMQCYSEKDGKQCLYFRDHSETRHAHRELSWADEEED
jgi:hypothetical protein